MTPKFFKTAGDFRRWLEAHHADHRELLVGFHKVKSGKPSMTWSESVDQALCFGWIDGVRKRIDDESYTIGFTPRRDGSIWSAINIKKVEDLEKKGLMRRRRCCIRETDRREVRELLLRKRSRGIRSGISEDLSKA